jgi:Cft2 family RNA processing exonuclease
METTFQILGGGNEIGANSFRLQIGKCNVILDCGLHPRNRGIDIFPDYELIKDETIEHLIVTHAHNDHLGALPYFLKLFPYAKVYMTRPTLAVAEVTLGNTSYLMEREFRDTWDKSFIQYYNEEMLNLIPMIIKHYDYNVKVGLKPEVTFEFYDAGHILGSAGVLIEAGEKSIFFTGDFNLQSQKLIPKAILPSKKVDVLITECTNGALDELPKYSAEEKRLAAFINGVTTDGGSVLIPVFALGKAQEMLKRINDLMEKNRIPRLPVYYSPMSNAINNVYDMYNYTVTRVDKGYKLGAIRTNILRREDIFDGDFYKKPSIILATSGMMIEGTASFHIAKNFLRRSNFGIAVCGYCDPETPGYQIKNSKRYQRVYLNKFDYEGIDVRCSIGNFKFSAHVSREGILEIVKKLNPEKVFLVHGDEDAINRIGREILEAMPHIKVTAPEKLKVYNM